MQHTRKYMHADLREAARRGVGRMKRGRRLNTRGSCTSDVGACVLVPACFDIGFRQRVQAAGCGRRLRQRAVQGLSGPRG